MWLTLARCLIKAFNLSVAQRTDKHSQNKGEHIISVLTKIEKLRKDLPLTAEAKLHKLFQQWSESTVAYFILAHFYPSAAVSIFNLKDGMNAFVKTGEAACVNLKQGITLCLVRKLRQKKWV